MNDEEYKKLFEKKHKGKKEKSPDDFRGYAGPDGYWYYYDHGINQRYFGFIEGFDVKTESLVALDEVKVEG